MPDKKLVSVIIIALLCVILIITAIPIGQAQNASGIIGGNCSPKVVQALDSVGVETCAYPAAIAVSLPYANLTSFPAACTEHEYISALVSNGVTCSASLGVKGYTNSTSYSLTTVTGAFNQLGFELYFTPNTTAVSVLGSFSTQTSLAGCGTYVQLDYGTGTAPVQGVSQTGTLVGSPVTYFFGTGLTGLGFSQPMANVVTGLSAGTKYWFDFAFTSAPGNGCGTGTFNHATLVLLEY